MTTPARRRRDRAHPAAHPHVRLVLASASPARHALLVAAGIVPQVVVSDVDEDAALVAAAEEAAQTGRDLPVSEQVAVLARAKAEAVAATLSTETAPRLVLGCDSLLELDGVAHGKPGTPERARAAWASMRGRSGVLHSGHHLIATGAFGVAGAKDDGANDGVPGTTRTRTAVSSTTVHFADISDEEIAAYVATGEPLQVAGAFTIDGVGGAFVAGVDGDHHGVLGLSLPLLRTVLADLGIPYPALWT